MSTPAPVGAVPVVVIVWLAASLVEVNVSVSAVEETDAHWLYKGFKHDVLVDVIFRSAGDIFLDDEMLARSSLVDHGGQSIRIIAPEDLVVIKAVVSAEHVPQHWYDALGVLDQVQV